MRESLLTFPEMTSVAVPKSESFASNHDKNIDINELDFISAVVDRWRRATMNQQAGHEEPMRMTQSAPSADAPPLQPVAPPSPAPIEANRLSLLKKPIAADDLGALRRQTVT